MSDLKSKLETCNSCCQHSRPLSSNQCISDLVRIYDLNDNLQTSFSLPPVAKTSCTPFHKRYTAAPKAMQVAEARQKATPPSNPSPQITKPQSPHHSTRYPVRFHLPLPSDSGGDAEWMVRSAASIISAHYYDWASIDERRNSTQNALLPLYGDQDCSLTRSTLAWLGGMASGFCRCTLSVCFTSTMPLEAHDSWFERSGSVVERRKLKTCL